MPDDLHLGRDEGVLDGQRELRLGSLCQLYGLATLAQGFLQRRASFAGADRVAGSIIRVRT